MRLNSIGCNFNSEFLDIVILREYNEKRALALATKMKMASLKALLVCSKWCHDNMQFWGGMVAHCKSAATLESFRHSTFGLFFTGRPQSLHSVDNCAHFTFFVFKWKINKDKQTKLSNHIALYKSGYILHKSYLSQCTWVRVIQYAPALRLNPLPTSRFALENRKLVERVDVKPSECFSLIPLSLVL